MLLGQSIAVCQHVTHNDARSSEGVVLFLDTFYFFESTNRKIFCYRILVIGTYYGTILLLFLVPGERNLGLVLFDGVDNGARFVFVTGTTERMRVSAHPRTAVPTLKARLLHNKRNGSAKSVRVGKIKISSIAVPKRVVWCWRPLRCRLIEL